MLYKHAVMPTYHYTVRRCCIYLHFYEDEEDETTYTTALEIDILSSLEGLLTKV